MKNSIVKLDTNKNISKQGMEIIENNDFFRDLSNIMENDEFNTFFKKYLNDWVDVKAIIVYMILYSEFKEKYWFKLVSC